MVLVRSDASTAPSARELVEGAEIDTGIDALRIVRLSKKFGHVPLTGLDAASARQVKDVLRERVRAGGTVILTTHILEVAERLSDRIGIIHSGRLIAEGTFDELRERAGMPGSTLEAVFLDLVSDARSTA